MDDYIGEVGKPCYTPTATTGGHVSFAGLIKYGHAGFLLPTLIFAGVRPLDRLVPDDMRLMMTKSGYMEDFSFISCGGVLQGARASDDGQAFRVRAACTADFRPSTHLRTCSRSVVQPRTQRPLPPPFRTSIGPILDLVVWGA